MPHDAIGVKNLVAKPAKMARVPSFPDFFGSEYDWYRNAVKVQILRESVPRVRLACPKVLPCYRLLSKLGNV